MAKTKNGIQWRNRIVKYGSKPASQFQAHPRNWRQHPKHQREALAASLNGVGWGGVVLENVRTGHLLDGHERLWQALDLGDETPVPYIAVDVSEDEEHLILATLDPIGAMAATDAEMLESILADLRASELVQEDEALDKLLHEVAASANVPYGEYAGEDAPTAEQARRTLAERFIVPPFSVLDARQGYWQERKRAWIALGIQSELGRGMTNLGMAHPETTSTIDFYKQKRELEHELGRALSKDEAAEMMAQRGRLKNDRAQNAARALGAIPSNQETILSPDYGRRIRGKQPAVIGGSPLPLDRRGSRRSNAPGGSPRPAATLGKDGKTIRGDGRGRPLANGRGPARAFGQDLMRGEHVVGRPNPHDSTPPHGPTVRQAADGTLEYQESWGTSIFDPVLCELAYRWFCPPDGLVLDPFAGGSVRGIVAAWLGRRYVGVDLRPEQVAANEHQAKDILADRTQPASGDTVYVKISAKSARQLFNGCDPEYIRNVCHAACCHSTTSPTGTLITIHPTEQARIEARGGEVKDGLLQPRAGERRCPFKTDDHLCGLHFTPDKPFGCIASPFTLSKGKTLIVRNRYRLLKCYNDGARIPAYRAFRASLDLIFGEEEAARICDHLDNGGGDVVATMSRSNYDILCDNDAIKHGEIATGSSPAPCWIVGDSRDLDTLWPDEQCDFVFTCPPYFDLEIYSDDPADLSNAGSYDEFMGAYRDIIAASIRRLRADRFACVVVGDIRDKQGLYRNFVSDTIAAFQSAGAALYNEAILVTSVGSLPIRVGKQFEAGRKLGKTHQNVLVFVKGDPRRAVAEIGPVEFGNVDEVGQS